MQAQISSSSLCHENNTKRSSGDALRGLIQPAKVADRSVIGMLNAPARSDLVFGGIKVDAKIGTKLSTKPGANLALEMRPQQPTNKFRQQECDDAQQHGGGTESDRQPSDGTSVDLARGADQDPSDTA